MSRPHGFTLVEMLVAMGIMTVVVGGVFSVFNPMQGAFQSQPETADMQDRLRMAANGMASDIVMAGAGSYRSATKGSLGTILAPIVPYRLGALSPDPAAGVFFRSDAITVTYVSADAPETALSAPMASTASDLQVTVGAGCQTGTGVCGFTTDDRVLIFDQAGSFDTFTVTGTNSASNSISHAGQPFSRAYPTGSRIVRINMTTFFKRTDATTGIEQLVQYDGRQTELALVDNLVALQFEYFGDPARPVLTSPPTNPEGPWTTYGPKPPALGVDNTADSWPAGENCTFTVTAGEHVSRLATLGTGGLAPLTQAQLTDGPWCPDAASPNRYDADLTRVRKVRVTIRVQASDASMRGPAGTLFTRGGQGKEGARFVPDQQVVFDVTPRNVNLNR